MAIPIVTTVRERGMSRTLRAMAALAVLVTLAACQSAPTSSSEADRRQPITAVEAVAAFEGICGASLPNFAGAKNRMAAFGITAQLLAGSDTIHSPTKQISFKILDGPGLGKTCSMVFATQERPATVQAAFNKLGTFIESSLGRGTFYADRALVLQPEATRRGGGTYYNLRMLSERN